MSMIKIWFWFDRLNNGVEMNNECYTFIILINLTPILTILKENVY